MSHNTSENNELAEDEFIVSRVAGVKMENGYRYFLIEWDGYELTDNTWEEESNVYSETAINKFVSTCAKQYHKRPSKSILKSQQKLLLHNTYDPDTNTYFKPRTQPNIAPATTTTKVISTTTTTSLNTLASSKRASTGIFHQQRRSNKRLKESIECETESVVVSKPLNEIRQGIANLSIETCRAFEKNIEDIKQSVKIDHPIVQVAHNYQKRNIPLYQIHNLKSKVTILNEVDSEVPNNFIYIDQLKYTSPVQPPDPDFLPGCGCPRHGECKRGCHDVVAYDDHGRLLIDQGTAIYECNQACECGPKCKNRIVQRGRKVPLQVFKTVAKGWGVRSTQFIPKGTFIEEYVGEVITVEEGDTRGVVYDKLGCSYLFDMDFAQSELPTKYVIDSFVLGNVSRFFNHSCSPNLEVYAVFYDSADNQMHRLAFFAKRDINKDEELCFDYNGRRDVANHEDVEDAARYSCHCDAEECRKWIYQ